MNTPPSKVYIYGLILVLGITMGVFLVQHVLSICMYFSCFTLSFPHPPMSSEPTSTVDSPPAVTTTTAVEAPPTVTYTTKSKRRRRKLKRRRNPLHNPQSLTELIGVYCSTFNIPTRVLESIVIRWGFIALIEEQLFRDITEARLEVSFRDFSYYVLCVLELQKYLCQ